MQGRALFIKCNLAIAERNALHLVGLLRPLLVLHRAYKCPSELWRRPPSSETCHRRGFTRTRFEYGQQPRHFQRFP